jgi:DNA polymerase III sliding clamp (beta) subunit (PCNA family)
MQVHLNPEQARTLHRALVLAKRFLSSQGTRPEEAVLQLQAGESRLFIEVPSADVAYRSSVAHGHVDDLDSEQWHIPATLLIQIITGGDGIVLNLDRDSGFMIVHRGVSRWTLPLYKGVSVPTVQKHSGDATPINGTRLHAAIDHVRFSVGGEDDRPYLRALSCENGRVRGCNGSMYSHYDLDEKISFLVPAHAVDALRAYLKYHCGDDTAEIWLGETDYAHHFITSSDSVSVSKQAMEYPDLNTILVRRVREQLPCVLKVSPLELHNALSSVAVLTDKYDTTLELTMEREKLHLKCAKRGGAEAETTIDAKWATTRRKAHFDVRRFKDLLNSVAASGEQEWEVKFGHDTRDRKSPIVIEGKNSWSMLNQVRQSP